MPKSKDGGKNLKATALPSHFNVPDPRNVVLTCTVADRAHGGAISQLLAWLGDARVVLVADDESGKATGLLVYEILGRETGWEEIVGFLRTLTWQYPDDARADEVFYQTENEPERGPRVWTAVWSKAMERRP